MRLGSAGLDTEKNHKVVHIIQLPRHKILRYANVPLHTADIIPHTDRYYSMVIMGYVISIILCSIKLVDYIQFMGF